MSTHRSAHHLHDNSGQSQKRTYVRKVIDLPTLLMEIHTTEAMAVVALLPDLHNQHAGTVMRWDIWQETGIMMRWDTW